MGGIMKSLTVGALALAFAAGSLSLSLQGASARSWGGHIELNSTNGAEDVSTDDMYAWLGFAGDPISLHFSQSVGWWEKGTLVQPAVRNPEWEFFCPNGQSCDIGMALNLTFDVANGTISGTPLRPGKFVLYPAVRDKNTGEEPLPEFKWTMVEIKKANGKTWIASKFSNTILILPQPSPVQVNLQCAFEEARFGTLLLTLDYGQGYAKVLGADGSIRGLYRIDPAADIVSWKLMPIHMGFYTDDENATASHSIGQFTDSVALDRITGTLTMTAREPVNGLSRTTAHCQKRSTQRSF
jgi:hypothetical protein